MPPSKDPMRISLVNLPPRLLEGGRLAHYTQTKQPVPTGSAELDSMLNGGWPRHEISYIQGESGSGKSSLCEEAALSFLHNGGDLSVIFSLPGEHPLSGFQDRVKYTNRFLLGNNYSLPEAFCSLETLCSSNGELDIFAVVDDLSSLTPDHKQAVKQVMQGLQRISKFLTRNLTLLLVNQIRDISTGSVGATAYNKVFKRSSVAVHLGLQDYIRENNEVVGFRSNCVLLAPESKQGQEFQMFLRYGVGVVG